MLGAVTDPDARHGLGRASALMASGSMASRALGVVRNALQIACIGGTGAASDAFATANTLPNIIFNLLSTGLLTAILIPQIVRAMRRGDAGRQAIDALLTLAYVVVAAVTLVAVLLTGPLIVALGLSGPARDLGIAFAYLCLPQILFYGTYAIWSQVLNVRGRFGITMWTPALANVVQIAGMVFFLSRYVGKAPAERWTPEMVWVLAGTFTLGVAVQALGLLPALHASGFRWRPSLRFRGHGFRTAGRVASWMILAVAVSTLGGLVTQAAINVVSGRARALDASAHVAGVQVYQTAFLYFMVPHGIITVSILTALFPRLARSAQAGDLDALRADVTRGVTLPALAMVPLSLAAVALAVPGIAVLTPSFTPEDVRAAALAFSLMSLGLFPYGLVYLQQRYCMALEDGRTNLWFQLVVTGVQMLAAGLILVLPDALGVPAVSAGQTIGNAAAALAFLWYAQRRLGGLPLERLASLTGRLALASAVPAGLAWWATEWLGSLLGRGLGPALVTLLAGAAVFAPAFLIMVRVLRVAELTALLRAAVRRVLPGRRAGADSGRH